MVLLINHGMGDRLLVSETDSKLAGPAPSSAETTPTSVTWEECTDEEKSSGFRIRIQHGKVSDIGDK